MNVSLEDNKVEIQEILFSSADVSNMLNLSSERIRQLIKEKALPPKYIFNKNSMRKQYIFEKSTVEEYIKNGKVDWYDSQEMNLLSIPEINNFLNCPTRWVHDSTREGKLTPSMIIGNTSRKIYLYDIESVQTAFMNRSSRGSEKGYKKSTLQLIDNIRGLNEEGLNDSDIAKRLNKKQSFISKLRKDNGLSSKCGRGRPRLGTDKILTHSNT